MTIEEARSKIEEIQNRTDIGSGQKTAMTMRIIAQYRRANPEAEVDELGL